MLGPAIVVAGGLVLMHGTAWAQGFPGPLPNAAPANNAASPFPPVNSAPQQSAFPPAQSAFPPAGQSSFPSGPTAPIQGGGGFSMQQQQQAQEPPCMKDFLPLRTETERRAKLVQAANQKRVSPEEACKVINNFSQAEEKMLKFVEVNAKSCGIPAEIPAQLKAGHARTTDLLKRVCDAAAQRASGGGGGAPAMPSLSEIIGSTPLPDAPATKRAGGSTFDTINGNVLSR
jgi:hypothetical protein